MISLGDPQVETISTEGAEGCRQAQQPSSARRIPIPLTADADMRSSAVATTAFH